MPPPYHPWNYCPDCGRRLLRRSDGERPVPYCPACRRHYYHNPPPVVACAALRGGRILMVRRAVEPARGRWALPGGFIDLGEAPEEAARRELREETGLSGRVRELLGVLYQPSETYGSVVVIGYLLDGLEGEARPGTDAAEAAFFDFSRAPEAAFSSHRALVAAARERAGA